MDLAVALGYVHADELLDRLSWKQFTDWLAYLQIAGPLGQDRHDQRQLALLLSIGAPFTGDEPPALVWPYFHAQESVTETHSMETLQEAQNKHLYEYGYRDSLN